MDAKFSIGQQFKPVGKRYICTIVDILRTYNAADELVRVRYVATHEFAGQTVTESDVCQTTVARGLLPG